MHLSGWSCPPFDLSHLPSLLSLFSMSEQAAGDANFRKGSCTKHVRRRRKKKRHAPIVWSGNATDAANDIQAIKKKKKVSKISNLHRVPNGAGMRRLDGSTASVFEGHIHARARAHTHTITCLQHPSPSLTPYPFHWTSRLRENWGNRGGVMSNWHFAFSETPCSGVNHFSVVSPHNEMQFAALKQGRRTDSQTCN